MCSFFICKLKKSCKLNLFAAGFFPPVELARALLACTVGSAGGAHRKGPGPRSPRGGLSQQLQQGRPPWAGGTFQSASSAPHSAFSGPAGTDRPELRPSATRGVGDKSSPLGETLLVSTS